ncbi:hypothetical protein LY28_01628 [Ruminiclostridium sufflavum DSM 19573]|uniref:Uncharacterized protein n=1 Tax=Ruminiclostridium sufflavum DSM 19573 TaxID=1121337 RepID=A0A318XMJ4_9FIRM|nr:hypothetical protein [Ruminiclostridium sufflavum]PYG87918.1 hypothetical protein LY28_01628 [Ruminiclostridium sufflavum DSM 19573]
MSKVKAVRILVIAIAAVFIIQAGYTGYSKLGIYLAQKQAAEVAGESSQEENNNFTAPAAKADNQLKDGTDTEISQEILELIKASDPAGYEKNKENYINLLKNLNVHTIFKNEIERLIKEGCKLPDILTAYSYLNDSYGSIGNLEKLVKAKESGEGWADIFKAYNKSNPGFKPKSFDSKYLEELLNLSGIDEDSIMIADRVSQNAKADFKDVISKKTEGLSWRLIKAQYGIANGQEKSPRLSLTREQLTKYTKQAGLSEEEVVKALTIAQKLGKSADNILKSIKQGLSEEEIYASAYEEKYY